ncbi:hypothetical protein MKX68_07440 [Paenibacillus sp. FSL M8-0212]
MKIMHYLSAMNSQNQLNKNNKTASKSLEKLSTGLRINQSSR